jgi:hypothetical protein
VNSRQANWILEAFSFQLLGTRSDEHGLKYKNLMGMSKKFLLAKRKKKEGALLTKFRDE